MGTIRKHIEKCASGMHMSAEDFILYCSRTIGADYAEKLNELLRQEEQAEKDPCTDPSKASR